MATAFFTRSYRRTHLLVSPLLRSPNNLSFRYISETKQIPDENEASNTPKSVPVSTANELIRRGYGFLDTEYLGSTELKDMGILYSGQCNRSYNEIISKAMMFGNRTADEFKAGHPSGAINIAYMHHTKSGMLKNPQFEQEVLSSYTKDDQIIIGCRSGKRSLMAAHDLTSLGFQNIVDLAGGYIAWTQNGLPVHKPE